MIKKGNYLVRISDGFGKNIWGDMMEKGGVMGRKNSGYIVDGLTQLETGQTKILEASG